ncbi:MAG: TlyA family RNA methyltransferase [Ruminococcaceae bacterium]|nr:TlyA family RNA methyltransferase [Oscillospiraceae bacterium]
MRLDVYLCEKKLAKSRTAAAKLITKGLVTVNGKVTLKASESISETDTVEAAADEECRYVSRGGLKLEGALKEFSVDVTGMVCIDVGASTGGFTDCLLKNGAQKVYAVENGSAQLDSSLENDSRVISMENVNARYMTEDSLPERCNIAVMDVSFISQTLIYDALHALLNDDGIMITLIKPQFETALTSQGRKLLGKNGVIKDDKARLEILKRIKEEAEKKGFLMERYIVSPIKGGDGNVEYLALFHKK